MNKQTLLDAIEEAEKESAAHYTITIDWCKQTGFPLYWIAAPIKGGKSTALNFGSKPFERVRKHQKGHGWKANHAS